jgi:uncharacterized protein YjiS (DUF1127 family)
MNKSSQALVETDMLQLALFSRGLWAFTGLLRRSWRSRQRESPLRLEHLSCHLLRDLGFSSREIQDLAAQERDRFLT